MNEKYEQYIREAAREAVEMSHSGRGYGYAHAIGTIRGIVAEDDPPEKTVRLLRIFLEEMDRTREVTQEMDRDHEES